MSQNKTPYSLFLTLLLAGLLTPLTGYSKGSGGSAPAEPWLAEECRSCHDDYENLPLKVSNPDNHHIRYGTPILHTTAPNSAADDDGLYDCLTCHTMGWNELGYPSITLERDCLQCHELLTVANRKTGNRHHDTGTAIGGQCDVCHCRMPEPHRSFNYCSSGAPRGN